MRGSDRGRATARRLAPALAAAAGAVDAAAYLGLEHVFVGNMTGNLVLLGIGAAQLDGVAVLRSTTALVGFLAGLLVDAAVLRGTAGDDPHAGQRSRRRRALLLAAEAVLLAVCAVALALLPDQRPLLAGLALTGLAGLAMGLQTAGSRGPGLGWVRTTYETGTLDELFGEVPAGLAPSSRWPVLATVLALYLGGAVVGVLLLQIHLAVPFAVAAVGVAVCAWLSMRLPSPTR